MRESRIGFSDKSIPYCPSSQFAIDTTITSTHKANVCPKEREEIIQTINYIKTFEDGWNGYNAKKPFELVIEAAKRFIQFIPFNRMYPDKISPDGEGGIIFTWSTQSGERILLVFEPGLLHIACESPKKETVLIDDIVYTGEEDIIPQKLLSYIPERKTNGYLSKM